MDIVNHPGDVIGIAGFFFDNTLFDIQAQILGLEDQSVNYFTEVCTKESSIFITCKLPSEISYFGYYMVTLYEVDTLYKLNDENILTIIILPIPTIVKTEMTTYAV